MPVSALREPGPAVHLLERERSASDALMVAILEHLNDQTVISLDTLVCLMPQYTWNQIFHCVDQLARCNKVALRRHRFEYMLFSPHFAA
jgi:hypothetical protein